MICAIYHEDLDNLDLEEMAFKFVERYPSRQHIFQVPAQVQEKFKKQPQNINSRSRSRNRCDFDFFEQKIVKI